MTRITLKNIINLQDTSFFDQLPPDVVRPLVSDHVKRLSYSDAEKWPPVKAALLDSDDGQPLYTLTDGYHRLAARKLQATELYKDLPTSDDLPPVSLEDFLDSIEIEAEVKQYTNLKALAIDALTANLTHGQTPDNKARRRIGYEWYKLTLGDEHAPSQSEIARQVGISRQTLNEYIKEQDTKERAEGAEAETPGEEGTTGAEVVEEKQAPATNTKKVQKKLDAFLSDLHTLMEEDKEGATEIVQKLLPYALLDFVSLLPDNAPAKQVETLTGTTLSRADDHYRLAECHGAYEQVGVAIAKVARDQKKQGTTQA